MHVCDISFNISLCTYYIFLFIVKPSRLKVCNIFHTVCKCAIFAPKVCCICPKCAVFALWCLTMQTVKTQEFNYKSVDIKIQFFSMGSRSRLAVLLRCWTWTEALVVASSWTNERLRAQAVESESTRDRYPSLTYLYSSLGLVSSGVFQKECCWRFFCTKDSIESH